MDEQPEESFLEEFFQEEELEEPITLIAPVHWWVLGSFLLMASAVILWAFLGSISIRIIGEGLVFNPSQTVSISSPLIGTVQKIHVRWGDTVSAGTVIATIAPNNEIVTADQEGVVFEIEALPGEKISPGDVILWLQLPLREGEGLQVAGVLPDDLDEDVRIGMPVEVTLANADPTEYGRVKGRVSALIPFWTKEAKNLFPVKHLKNESGENKYQSLIVVDLIQDQSTPSGYSWTYTQGTPFPIKMGVPCKFVITTEKKKPIKYLLP